MTIDVKFFFISTIIGGCRCEEKGKRGHFFSNFDLQWVQFFLLVRSNQEQLYVFIPLKIREK